jgi:hypothetical protein
MAIRIGHRGHVIWHCVTSFFWGGVCEISCLCQQTTKFLSSRWRFDMSLAKLSRNYAEMSSRVSSKE